MGHAQWGIHQALPVWPVSLIPLVSHVSRQRNYGGWRRSFLPAYPSSETVCKGRKGSCPGSRLMGLVAGEIGLSGIELVEHGAEGVGSEPPERKGRLNPRSS